MVKILIEIVGKLEGETNALELWQECNSAIPSWRHPHYRLGLRVWHIPSEWINDPQAIT